MIIGTIAYLINLLLSNKIIIYDLFLIKLIETEIMLLILL